MRIRTIKPEFWCHPVMARKDDSVRLAAIGLLNLADDEGYFLADPSLIRSALWPFDDDSSTSRRCVVELSSISYIEVRFCGGHGLVGKVVQFLEHQRVDKPKKSKLSAHFDAGKPMKQNDSSNDLGSVVDLSTNDLGCVQDQSSREGKGKEGNGMGMEMVQKPAGGSSGPPPAAEVPQADPEPVKALPAPRKAPEPPKSAETWAAYSSAYEERYHVEPVRNAKVNAQISQFIARIGAEEAPAVAAFYLTINKSFYIEKGHPTDILLKDAESLRMPWARGRGITRTEAQQADKRAARGDAFAPLLKETP